VWTNQFDSAAGNRPLTKSAFVSGHLWEYQVVSQDALLSVTTSPEALSCVAHTWYFPQQVLHPGVWPSYVIRDLKNGWVWNVWCAQINTNLLYWIQKHSSVYKSMLYSLNYYVNIKVHSKILLKAIFGPKFLHPPFMSDLKLIYHAPHSFTFLLLLLLFLTLWAVSLRATAHLVWAVVSWTHCHLLSVSSQSDLYSHITILNIVRPTALTVWAVLDPLPTCSWKVTPDKTWLYWHHCFVWFLCLD
jgi:hypothetical protein